MLFVVDKPRLQRMVALVRDDRGAASQGASGPFLRLEAAEGELRLTGREVEAAFPATVYEPGVLFLRVTAFRRMLQRITVMEMGTRHITIQVHESGLSFENVRLGFDQGDMLLYPDPAQAPAQHPETYLAGDDNPKPRSRQGRLFEDI